MFDHIPQRNVSTDELEKYLKSLCEKVSDLECTIEKMKDERIKIARSFDPNCDYYVYEDELEKMKSAFDFNDRFCDIIQRLDLNPESCWSNHVDVILDSLSDLQSQDDRFWFLENECESIIMRDGRKIEASKKSIDFEMDS